MVAVLPHFREEQQRHVLEVGRYCKGMAGAVDATCQLASGSFVVVTSEQLTYGLARGGAMSAARAPSSANRNDELIRTDRRPTVLDPRSPCEFSTCSPPGL
jgi:hypothetical protein